MKSGKASLTKNSFYYLVYNLLNVIFPFITGVYVAHVLLPADIGQVEVARNLATYFALFAFLGIPTYAIREISKKRNDKEALGKLYSELRIINTLSTAFFLAVYLILIFLIPKYNSNIVIYLITGLAIALNFLNNSWLFEGLEKFRYISLRNILFKAVSFVLLIIFVRDQNDYLWYATITVIGTAGNYLFNIINSSRFVSFTFRGLNLVQHLKPVFMLLVVNMAIEIYTMIDITMLGIMCSNEIVAFYSYGMKIQKILLQIINTFTMVLVPRLSLLHGEGKKEEFNSLLLKTLTVILIFAIPIIIGVAFVSDYIVTKVYGETYLESANVLKILSFAILISPIGYLLGSRVLLVTGNENKMILAVGSGAITNILLNFFLIKSLQDNGAAIASIIGEIVVATVYIILSHKFFEIDKKKLVSSIVKIFISSSLLFIFLVLASWIPVDRLFITIIQISVGVVVYFLALLLMKENVVTNFICSIKKRIARKNSI